jgi:hypothetical protein
MKTIKNSNNKFSVKLILMTLLVITSLSCSKEECEYSNDCFEMNSINISTGIDTDGTSISTGNVDPLWVIASSPYPSGTPALSSSTYSVWEPSPVPSTNANWINATGANCCTNLPGNYTFERDFTISSGTASFACNFGIAYDDSLIMLELVAPDSSTIPLTVTPTSAYFLSTPITDVVYNPMVGTWKIRATVNFFDVGAGFLTSGKIDIMQPCSN